MLDKLAPYTDAIHLQDSLQYLAQCPEAERNAAIDRVIDALKKKEKEERDRLAEQEAAQRQGEGQNMETNPWSQCPTLHRTTTAMPSGIL